jgi:hypothetical protein
MTKEELDKIRQFVQQLPTLRIQVSDGQLLDHCQQALQDLLVAYDSEAEENESRFPAHEPDPAVTPPEDIVRPEPPRFVEAPPPEDVMPSPKAPHRHEPEPKKRSHHAQRKR